MKSNWPTEELRKLAISAVGLHGQVLIKRVPMDAAEYGWDGRTFSHVEFYSEILGALAKYESNFNPDCTFKENFEDRHGNPVISRGLLQLSIESCNAYGAKLKDPLELHDPFTNLRCAVLILNRWIPKDGVIAAYTTGAGGGYRGFARYWSPFRKPERVAAIKKAMKQVFEQPKGEEKQVPNNNVTLKEVIKNLQEELNEMGANPPLKVDGIPGPKTLAALAAATAKESIPFNSKLMHPIDLLRTKIGLKEVPGKLHNREIQEFLEACDNIGGRKDTKLHPDEVPWCSGVINWLAEQCGMVKTNNALAASWDKYNEDCGDWVEEGDIVTLAQPGRHVTLANKRFNRKTAKTFEGLGGNQGNMVKVSTYSVSKIKAARKWKTLDGSKVPSVKSKASNSTADGSKESTR